MASGSEEEGCCEVEGDDKDSSVKNNPPNGDGGKSKGLHSLPGKRRSPAVDEGCGDCAFLPRLFSGLLASPGRLASMWSAITPPSLRFPTAVSHPGESPRSTPLPREGARSLLLHIAAHAAEVRGVLVQFSYRDLYTQIFY